MSIWSQFKVLRTNGPGSTGVETRSRTFLTEFLIYMLKVIYIFILEHNSLLKIGMLCVVMFNEDYNRLFTTVKIKSLR